MTTPSQDPKIQESDQKTKAKMKIHADNKQYKPLRVGHTVLVKRDDSKKKSDTPYDPKPHTVIEKKGCMVTAEYCDGIPVTRNSSFF